MCFAVEMRVSLCALTLASLSVASVESLDSLAGITIAWFVVLS